MLTKLDFSRFEFKFVMARSLREDIETELQFFLTLDPFVSDQPGHRYFVRSVYFDDGAWTCYHEKDDGMLHREKFRVRTYSDDPTENVATFLEIKGRHDALVFKHRVQMTVDGSSAVGGRSVGLTEEVLEGAAHGPVLDRFRFQLERMRLRPVVRIDYFRRPYVSRFDPAFRLTFDDDLVASQTQWLHPRGLERHRRFLAGFSILEVKFSHHVPSWFHRIIQSYDLSRVSISKYCRGVEALGLAAGNG